MANEEEGPFFTLDVPLIRSSLAVRTACTHTPTNLPCLRHPPADGWTGAGVTLHTVLWRRLFLCSRDETEALPV